jgi:hypothetical protein
LIISFL